MRREALPPGHEGLYDAAPPYSIVIGKLAHHPALTLLHEIGHVLDHHALGGSVPFGSVADSSMATWRAAVRNSRAFVVLAEAARVSTVPDLLPVIGYLNRPEELWARSYAQYIVGRSGEPELAAELADRRRRLSPQVYIPRQWDDDDFAPIAEAISDAFRKRGWIR